MEAVNSLHAWAEPAQRGTGGSRVCEAMVLDKRGHLRVPVRIPVCCTAPDSGGVSGLLTDISLGGSCIRSDQVLPFGTKVTVVARLPGASVDSRLPGVVRWSTPGCFGVEFQRLDARDTYGITDLMLKALRTRSGREEPRN